MSKMTINISVSNGDGTGISQQTIFVPNSLSTLKRDEILTLIIEAIKEVK